MESEQSTPGTTNMQRQTAFKVRVAELLRGSYVKEAGWQPNYIDAGDKKVSRANIIGIVIAVVEEASFKNILVDDGSGRISLRMFENRDVDASLGDVVLVIGRPREFGGERYIVPEIIRKIDQKWFAVRKKELESDSPSLPVEETVVESPSSVSGSPASTVEESVDDPADGAGSSPVDRLLTLIKRLDSGSGALFDDVARESKLQNCEEYINRLLELGEIFEVKPGRFKVLE